MRRSWCGRPAAVGFRTLASLFLAAAIGLSAAGCWTGASDEISSPITIVFWHGQRGEAGEFLDQLAAEFSAVTRNVTVRTIYQGDPQTVVKLLREAAPGDLPAVAEVPDTSLSSLRAGDLIRPLQTFIARKDSGLRLSDLDDFWPCLIDTNSVGQQVWGLPFSHRVYGLIYNRDLVQEPPRTWEELKDVAAVLTHRPTDPTLWVFGLALRADTSLYSLFLYQNGGRLAAGEPLRCAVASREGVETLDYLYELTCMRRSVLLTVGSPRAAVAEGLAAMAVAPLNARSVVSDEVSLALAPLPSGSRTATLAPGTSLVMSAGGGPVAAEASWRFLRWLASPEIAARWATTTGDVPIRRSVCEDRSWRAGPGASSEWRAVVAQMDLAVTLPEVVRWEEFQQNLTGIVSTYLLGRSNSARSVLELFSKTADEYLGGP